jgi:hypothetical protein
VERVADQEEVRVAEVAVGGRRDARDFEFFTQRSDGSGDGPVSYLIELGGMGLGEQVKNGMLFGNGFDINVGMRFYP